MKPRSPMLPLLLLALLAIPLAGCHMTPAQRMSAYQDAAAQGQTYIAQLSNQVTQLEAKIDAAKVTLQGVDGEIAVKVNAAIDKARAVLDGVLANRADARAALKNVQDEIAKIQAHPTGTWGDDLNVLATSVQSGAALAPPPFDAYLGLAGILIGAIGGIFGGLKGKQKKDTEAAAANVVRSVSAAMSTLDAATKEKVKQTLATHQTGEAKALVAKAKA